MKLELANDTKIARVLAAATASTGDVLAPTDGIDMAGFDSVCFVAALGAVTATGVVTFAVAQSTDNAVADAYAALEGASIEVTGDAEGTYDDKLLVIDIRNPGERYLKPSITRATENAVVDGIFAVLYNSTQMPVAKDTTVAARVSLISPAEAA